uniref:MRN complex-interacting protein N-terminal domain-containing protein n=1 Tax=Rhodosorus marinus TaxID=101924 RepID=A0A7S0BU63_9RHOD|mmetsp:Transcript_7722/g.11457  ORF Transcript_7722/g.11457 Transcript_7722/m.11457 type:complete len:193 (+) Transcript_7722:111-689(+)
MIYICVLCFSCRTFQASTLRRDRKFVCKVCGIKQSVRKIIAQSHAAKDIRPVVQKLNRSRDSTGDESEEGSEDGDWTSSIEGAPSSSEVQQGRELSSTSCWSRYEGQERSTPRGNPANPDEKGARENLEALVPSNIPGTEENETTRKVEAPAFKSKAVVGIRESRAHTDLQESKAVVIDILAQVDDREWGVN